MSGERREDAYFTEDQVEHSGETTDTEVYEGESEEPIALEGLAGEELREGETDDPDVATEEGLTWVPPIDPPVVADADDPDGFRTAAGYGVEATEDPFDADHKDELLSVGDELDERIRDALRADAATSRYAESLIIGHRGGVVIVRGVVDDIEDSDDVVGVISEVPGVNDVVDETEVAALGA
jgi:hypothetical protein